MQGHDLKTQSDELVITFDAHYARITPPPPLELELKLRVTLCYENKAIAYFNYAKNWRKNDPKPTEVCLYDAVNHTFPTGLIIKVLKVFASHKQKFKVVNLIDAVEVKKVDIPEEAFRHQKEFVETILLKRRGIISSPTGSGKTRTAAYFLKMLPETYCIFTVPSAFLLEQTVQALETELEEPVGKVGDGSKTWKRITVGIINSLANLAEKDPDSEYLRRCGVLIIDECHEGASPRYKTLSSALTNTDFRIGLSATPKRTQGDDLVLEGILGPIIADVKETELVELQVIMKPTCLAIPIKAPDLKYSGFYIDKNGNECYKTPNGLPKDSEVYEKALVQNDIRNETIVALCEAFSRSTVRTGPALVLVDKVEHGFRLQNLISSAVGMILPYLHGEVRKEEREEALERLISNEIPIAIASRVLNRGYDIPNLDTLILAGGGAGGNKIVQQIGRVVRTNKGSVKRNPIVIDFADEEPFYLRRHFNKRRDAIEARYQNEYQVLELEKAIEVILGKHTVTGREIEDD